MLKLHHILSNTAGNGSNSGGYGYTAFGFRIYSEICCPELPVCISENVDVCIRFGGVSFHIENPLKKTPFLEASADDFVLDIRDIAKFWVYKGKEITIDPYPSASQDDIRLFLLGSAFGALIHQRRLLPVHGSAVKVDKGCVIFSGNSGAGKSTLAATFVQKGFQMLADDVCVITFNDQTIPFVQPGYPQVKLWKDSLLQLGENPENYRRIRENYEKHALATTGTGFCDHPLPLKRIFILHPSDKAEPDCKELLGMEKFNALAENTYRFTFLIGTESKIAHFRQVSQLAKYTKIFRIERPQTGTNPEQMFQLVNNYL
ncbi:MAG: hypothetical protein Q8910_15315 [Bacteroidota bacterium]|nr:hypothetical protein [Bacteroidota bacterium]